MPTASAPGLPVTARHWLLVNLEVARSVGGMLDGPGARRGLRVCTVKAGAPFASTSFGPDAIKVLTGAFDEAWVLIGPSVSARPDAIEAARTRLATLILGLAQKAGKLDAEQLRDDAVHLMLAELTKRRPKG
jgi:hypothetical protein